MNQPSSTHPRRRIRRGSAVAVVFATVLAIAGCSSTSTSDESKEATTTTEPADAGGAPVDNAIAVTTPGMAYDAADRAQAIVRARSAGLGGA